jgi:signal transduction histidine kinase
MTQRILAGFLGVLLAVIAAIVVPLGVLLSAQQRDDFRDGTHTAVRAVAAVAEEQLDDQTPAALTAALTQLASAGDRIIVLDAAGTIIGRAGTPLPAAALAAVRTGQPVPSLPDSLVATAPVADGGYRAIGLVLIARDIGPLAHRQHVLWAWLVGAAVAALLIGAGVGCGLSRWIARPLHSLAGAAHRIGAGQTTARTDPASGPPELRQLAGSFNTMADRVAALLETQRGMIAEVSHQLRTPLTALRLRLELFSTDLDRDRADEVAAMLEETARLARLVDGLLAVARADAAPSTPQPIDLATVAQERLIAWQPVADERGVELQLHASRARAMAVPGHVEQILDNLLDNALAAAPAQAKITVTASSHSTHAVLIVADTGPGMSAERRAQALNRYYTDRAGEGGTGLGLHVIARLAAADHGTTSLRETAGGGLTVEIRLPAGHLAHWAVSEDAVARANPGRP